MSERQRRKNGRRRWRRFLWIYSAAFLLLGALLLWGLWRFCKSYEASRPQYAVETYMESMTEDEWLAAALAAPDRKETEFEKTDDLIRTYFETNCRGGHFTCRELAGVSAAKAPVFQICSNGAGICRVYLEPDGSAGFGFTYWRIGRVTAGLSLPSLSAEILAPAGESVSINGIVLSSAYIADDHVSVTELTPLEHRFSADLFSVLYRVDGLCGEFTVTDSRGKRIYPTTASAQSDIRRYEIGTLGEYSFRVIAPADFELSLNGAVLGKSEETGRSVGMAEGLERYLNGYSMETVTYTARGLHRRAELTVTPPPGVSYVSETRTDGTLVYRRAPTTPSEEQRRAAGSFFMLALRYAADDFTAYDALCGSILRAGTFYSRFWELVPELKDMGKAVLAGETPEYGDFTNCGADCFTCRVSASGETWEILFVRTDGLWIAAGMEKAV